MGRVCVACSLAPVERQAAGFFNLLSAKVEKAWATWSACKGPAEWLFRPNAERTESLLLGFPSAPASGQRQMQGKAGQELVFETSECSDGRNRQKPQQPCLRESTCHLAMHPAAHSASAHACTTWSFHSHSGKSCSIFWMSDKILKSIRDSCCLFSYTFCLWRKRSCWPVFPSLWPCCHTPTNSQSHSHAHSHLCLDPVADLSWSVFWSVKWETELDAISDSSDPDC